MEAYTESFLLVEIQNLKDELATSERKAERYIRLSAICYLICCIELTLFAVKTLSNELRNNKCHSCRKKLPSRNASVPAAASDCQDFTSTASSASPPLWRRVFHGRQRSGSTTDNAITIGPSHSLESAQHKNTTTPLPVLSEPEVAHTLSSSHPAPDKDTMSEKKPKPSNCPVVYNPEVERAFDIHSAYEVKYDHPVYCAKTSPDGQKVAIGLGEEGETFVNELRTGSNIW